MTATQEVAVHAPARELLLLAIDNGWSAGLGHGVDSGDSPYITVTAKRDAATVTVTWHTRETGTYRLFSVLLGQQNASLSKVREALAARSAA